MVKDQDIEKAAAEALLTCLGEIPFVHVERMPPEGQCEEPDVLVRVVATDSEHLVVGEVKGNGQPRLAREAINQLLRYQESYPGAYGVFIAPYVSPRAAELCEQAGVGFVDLAGNCRLSFGQVFIQKTGEKNRFARKRDLGSLYSPKGSRVLRVLLNDLQRSWKVQDLAGEANVSIGQTSNVKKLLSDREWIRAEREGIRLTEPEALLAEWAENQRRRRDRKFSCYSLAPVHEAEHRLAQCCAALGERYALTSFSASLRYAPMVRSQRVAAYVTGNIEEIMPAAGLKQVTSGANVTLITPQDDGVFYGTRDIDGLTVVSPLQAYLDLVDVAGRGNEAAEAILDMEIRRQWQRDETMTRRQ
ncbi:MAG: type IV toxin-antitoxin system AbiEi family antitoxin [Planctomycetota bacterium]